jgi:cyclophilin family peptidyl-prolyl cis-trans isomerase
MEFLQKYWHWGLIFISILLLVAGFMLYGTKDGKPKDAPATTPTPAASTTPVAKATWTTAPTMTIDTKKTYAVTMLTSQGPIEIELYAKDAPKTVNNFVFLAREKFYDGLTFHRVIKDFMIQGGDPLGTGTGGPGYQFEDEINSHKIDVGTLAMANAGPNTNGSQFYIVTEKAQPSLDGKYTVFGNVTMGMENVRKIAAVAVDSKDKPTTPVIIKQVIITEK